MAAPSTTRESLNDRPGDELECRTARGSSSHPISASSVASDAAIRGPAPPGLHLLRRALVRARLLPASELSALLVAADPRVQGAGSRGASRVNRRAAVLSSPRSLALGLRNRRPGSAGEDAGSGGGGRPDAQQCRECSGKQNEHGLDGRQACKAGPLRSEIANLSRAGSTPSRSAVWVSCSSVVDGYD